MKVAAVVLLSILPFSLQADSCWDRVLPGHDSEAFTCRLKEWRGDSTQLPVLLQSLFRVYLNNGSHPGLKQIFDSIRSGDSSMHGLREDLIQRYRDWNVTNPDTAAFSMIPSGDARLLFVLSAVNPQSMELDLMKAVYLAVYEEIRAAFLLNLVFQDQVGLLPSSEYSRLLEILGRMSWLYDPYLKGLNQYYQAVVQINLRRPMQASSNLVRARQSLEKALTSSSQQLGRKRTLFALADVDLLLSAPESAENRYLAILKMDPQDWNALMKLSQTMRQTGKCAEYGVWVEASITSKQQDYDVVVHCGNRELPEEEFEIEGPVIARLAS